LDIKDFSPQDWRRVKSRLIDVHDLDTDQFLKLFKRFESMEETQKSLRPMTSLPLLVKLALNGNAIFDKEVLSLKYQLGLITRLPSFKAQMMRRVALYESGARNIQVVKDGPYRGHKTIYFERQGISYFAVTIGQARFEFVTEEIRPIQAIAPEVEIVEFRRFSKTIAGDPWDTADHWGW
jgi:hypothetical protein